MNHVLQPIVCEKTGLEGGIAEVRCGSAHSVLLTTTGQVYVWGSNSHGQLGMSHISEVVSWTLQNNLVCLHFILFLTCSPFLASWYHWQVSLL